MPQCPGYRKVTRADVFSSNLFMYSMTLFAFAAVSRSCMLSSGRSLTLDSLKRLGMRGWCSVRPRPSITKAYRPILGGPATTHAVSHHCEPSTGHIIHFQYIIVCTSAIAAVVGGALQDRSTPYDNMTSIYISPTSHTKIERLTSRSGRGQKS